jgi:phenylacetic acid degradation operon negative regulatory protein
MILDLYGSSVRHSMGGWLASSALVKLMSDLSVDGQAVRSALARMKRRGMLVSETRDRRRGYSLSEETLEIIREGDGRIFHTREPARLSDGWLLVVFSVPETERNKRYLLRSRLEWLGFGLHAPGVWIAPARLAEDAEIVVRRLNLTDNVHLYEAQYLGFADLADVVRNAWDLGGLAALYDEYIRDHSALAAKWARRRQVRPDRESFVDFLTALHGWRRFPYLDPGLPSELLLDNWSGHRAATIFFSLMERLEPAAMSYMQSVVDGTAKG